jgi:uncharacterized beta-barrel protein YwiB (DUF1934 family)
MGNDAVITLEGLLLNGEAAGRTAQVMTEGTYFKREGAYHVSYKESEMTGMEGTTTSITVKDGAVTILRFGTVNTQWIFKEGGKHISHFDTGVGSFTIGVFANKVDSSLDENGGTIEIDYSIEAENMPLAENSIRIVVKKTGTGD